MADRGLVPVALACDRFEAELIVSFLCSCGVPATLSADDAGGQEPQLGGASVLVAAADEAAARRFLAEVDDGRG